MAPFSWKLVFVCDCKMYELLMTAWSPEEEVVWRSRLGPPHGKGQQPSSPAGFSWLGLDMKPLGSVTDDNCRYLASTCLDVQLHHQTDGLCLKTN